VCDIRPGCETLPLVDEKDEDEAADLVHLDRSADSELDAALKAGTRAAARELVAKLPLARSYFAVLDYASRRARERETAAFFELVAKHSRAGNTGDLLVDLVEGLDKQHVYEAVSLGYQAMRSCADEALKPCLAVLVSQQIYEPNLPTAYYRAASGLLVDAEHGAASELRVVVTSVVDLVAELSTADSRPLLVQGMVLDQPARTGAYWPACQASSDTEAARYKCLPSREQGPHFADCERLLVQHGWARAGSRNSEVISMNDGKSGVVWMLLNADRLTWFEPLRRCLAALDSGRKVPAQAAVDADDGYAAR